MLFPSLVILSLALNAAAHGAIVGIGGGAKGVAANGFGVKNGAAVVRSDVSVLSSKTGCGSTVNIASSITAAEAAGLPTVAADGSLSMTWFQINAGSDGGGPGTAFIDVTGTGNSFAPVTITKNFADGGANSGNPMTIQLSTTTACTGGSGSTCLLRVQNPAGPFGSCFAVASPAKGASAAVAGTTAAAAAVVTKTKGNVKAAASSTAVVLSAAVATSSSAKVATSVAVTSAGSSQVSSTSVVAAATTVAASTSGCGFAAAAAVGNAKATTGHRVAGSHRSAKVKGKKGRAASRVVYGPGV